MESNHRTVQIPGEQKRKEADDVQRMTDSRTLQELACMSEKDNK